MGGSLPEGGTILDPRPAEESLRKTIHSGEILARALYSFPGFSTPARKWTTSRRTDPWSNYCKSSARWNDVEIMLGLELPLSLADYQKLLGLVAHPVVRAYWMPTGTITWAIRAMASKDWKCLENPSARCI